MAPNAEPGWERALWDNDHQSLQALLNSEAPTIACFQLERHIRQLYMVSSLTPGRIAPDHCVARVAQLAAVLPDLRQQIGGWLEQRAYDLSVLQWIRRNSALFAVLGAGVTIAAGGPSWAELVQRLLAIALDIGHEIHVYEKTEHGVRAKVDRVERLGPTEEKEAAQILARIDPKAPDTELLMRGAQLCADLFQESLFQKVTTILYPGGKREPSPIHHAIAALAHWQKCGDDVASGWVSVINYNFDSLMNNALRAERVPYTLRFMRDRRIFRSDLPGDPRPESSLPLIHLHGFTPREPFFDIRGMNFIFSTRQFAALYQAAEETIVSYAVHQYIAHPAYVGLYVGCSFADEAMNSVLRDAAARFPGRLHYALVELPKPLQERDDPAILDRETARYTEMGVRPVWFAHFSEIPGLIQRLG